MKLIIIVGSQYIMLPVAEGDCEEWTTRIIAAATATTAATDWMTIGHAGVKVSEIRGFYFSKGESAAERIARVVEKSSDDGEGWKK